MTYAQRLHLKRVLSSLVTAILSISMLGAISTISTPTASAVSALATCANGSAAQNAIAVEPSHPTVMYIDSGLNPRIDAAYVGYRVSNRTGSTMKSYWASLDNFTGGVISLANPSDKYIELPEILNNEKKLYIF